MSENIQKSENKTNGAPETESRPSRRGLFASVGAGAVAEAVRGFGSGGVVFGGLPWT